MSEQKVLNISDHAEVEAHIMERAKALSREFFGNEKGLNIIMEFACHVFWLGTQCQQAQAEAKQAAQEKGSENDAS